MSTNFVKYSPRSVYHRTRSKSPKRWHKAVKSHSPLGPRNPNAFSRYLKNESTLDHLDRKSFKLPCGKTLAQSWGALRKAWLAFKIAHSNYDYDKMSEYAHIIRKLQLQMGIQVTVFDQELLNDQGEIELVVQNLEIETEKNEQNPEQNDLERTPEYDWNKDIILHTPIPDPRHELFLREKEKSSLLPGKSPAAIVNKNSINYDKSCYLGPPIVDEPSPESLDKHSIEYDRSSHSGPTFPPQKLKSSEDILDRQDTFSTGDPSYTFRGKKSCWYKVKKRKGCNYRVVRHSG